MFVFAAALGIAAAAVTPSYPTLDHAEAFRLVVRLTQPSEDFNSIQNTYISHIPTGIEGHQLMGQTTDVNKAVTFYLNGTTTAKQYIQVLTETFTDFSSGIRLDPMDGNVFVRTAYLNEGVADVGFSLKTPSENYAFLHPQTWAACKEKSPLDKNRDVIIFKQAVTTTDAIYGTVDLNIPRGCAAVRLVPECAKLDVLGEGSVLAPKELKPNHDNVIRSDCYKSVKDIEWSKYRPGP